MSSPTKDAEQSFSIAMQEFNKHFVNNADQDDVHLNRGYLNMCAGLRSLTVGVRATYMLLEEVQKEVRALKQQRQH
jgi:hypothetical protein